MSAIDVVADANVALKWFHEAGEEGVPSARALLDRFRDRRIALHVLDLTIYEVGNALLRGRVGASAAQTASVLSALGDICTKLTPDESELALAAELAERHGLTLYDAAYAAVARRRGARLATFDAQLLEASLGDHPSDLLRQVDG
jgi:predicted nucleic acid-binding protein